MLASSGTSSCMISISACNPKYQAPVRLPSRLRWSKAQSDIDRSESAWLRLVEWRSQFLDCFP